MPKARVRPLVARFREYLKSAPSVQSNIRGRMKNEAMAEAIAFILYCVPIRLRQTATTYSAAGAPHRHCLIGRT